jgi:hypothetical protein
MVSDDGTDGLTWASSLPFALDDRFVHSLHTTKGLQQDPAYVGFNVQQRTSHWGPLWPAAMP